MTKNIVMSSTMKLMDIMTVLVNMNAIEIMTKDETVSGIGTVIVRETGIIILITGSMNVIVIMSGTGTMVRVEIMTGITIGTGPVTERKIAVVTVIMTGNEVKLKMKEIVNVMHLTLIKLVGTRIVGKGGDLQMTLVTANPGSPQLILIWTLEVAEGSQMVIG